MVEEIIGDWIKEVVNLDADELSSHYTDVVENEELITAIYSYFEDIRKYYKVINSVDICSILFKYYRSGTDELKQFTLQFLPQIMYTYVNSVAHADKKMSRVMETLIIGIYNLEVVDENGQSKIISFRLPSLAQPSIYHEPVSLAPASLTESALRRLEQRESQIVRWGPFKPVDKIIAENRMNILTELLFCYHRHISLLAKQSLEHLCKVTSMIVTQGFSKSSNSGSGVFRRSSLCNNDGSVPLVLPRIPVSSSFLCQLLHCLYFAMFNGCKYESLTAIEDIYYRASYHCFNDVILLANAVKNSTCVQPPGHLESGQPGINTTVGNTTTLSKSMITNASFRTKKLPDDIPIQNPNSDESNSGLKSITEEKEENLVPEVHLRKSLPKMAASFGKKTKEKIAVAVKSAASGGKGLHKSNSIVTNGGGGTIIGAGGGDISEDESGIELCGPEISNICIIEPENSTTTTSFINSNNNNKSITTTSVTFEIETSKAMQVSPI